MDAIHCAKCSTPVPAPRLRRNAKFCSDRCRRRSADAAYHKTPNGKAKKARYWAKRGPRKRPALQRRCLLRAYGLTQEGYDRLLASQGGVCAVCHGPPLPGKNLSVDHCHRTGVVRGLLCRRCNLAAGHLRDDPKLVLALAVYLTR